MSGALQDVVGLDEAEGFVRWRKALDSLETDMPVYLENTAGGDHAMARHFDTIAREAAVDGVRVPYDKLLLATGSLPIIIPVPGSQLPGVLTYRDLDDVNAMLAARSCGISICNFS